jgi:hypothetical protein
MAIKANSAPDGTAYLSNGDIGPEGLSGSYVFARRKVPGEVVKVTKESVVYYP